MATKLQLRRGLSSEWAVANPLLAEGEVVLELDTHKFKIGNGIDNYLALPYSSGPAGPAGVPGPGVYNLFDKGPGGGVIFAANAFTNTLFEIALEDVIGGGMYGAAQWADAVMAAESATINGYSDWRLPLQDEVTSIASNFADILSVSGFVDFQGIFYWTGVEDPTNTDNAFDFQPTNGFAFESFTKLGAFGIRPVRSFAGSLAKVGPAGQPGPQGPQGITGPQGLAGDGGVGELLKMDAMLNLGIYFPKVEDRTSVNTVTTSIISPISLI